MRILGVMVVKNEADRYLRSCLGHMSPLFNDLCVYDDQSDDDTAELCKEYTPNVKVRPNDVPSFLEHEGRFRAASWAWFEESLKPKNNDWVVCFDADEFLVDLAINAEDVLAIRNSLFEHVKLAGQRGFEVVRVPFPEFFEVTERQGYLVDPKIRVDGFWGKITGNRIFRFRPNGEFNPKPMGCGSEPTYVDVAKKQPERQTSLRFLHLGYALKSDHQTKYERYSSLTAHGHANSHVESIVKPGRLQPWSGPWPKVRLGR